MHEIANKEIKKPANSRKKGGKMIKDSESGGTWHLPGGPGRYPAGKYHALLFLERVKGSNSTLRLMSR